VDLKKLTPLTEASPVYSAAKRTVDVSGDQNVANQWRYYLKKCMKNLSNDLLRSDD